MPVRTDLDYQLNCMIIPNPIFHHSLTCFLFHVGKIFRNKCKLDTNFFTDLVEEKRTWLRVSHPLWQLCLRCFWAQAHPWSTISRVGCFPDLAAPCPPTENIKAQERWIPSRHPCRLFMNYSHSSFLTNTTYSLFIFFYEDVHVMLMIPIIVIYLFEYSTFRAYLLIAVTWRLHTWHQINVIYSTVGTEAAASPCNQQQSHRLETAADDALLCFYAYM